MVIRVIPDSIGLYFCTWAYIQFRKKDAMGRLNSLNNPPWVRQSRDEYRPNMRLLMFLLEAYTDLLYQSS